jgi:hypothetical protein
MEETGIIKPPQMQQDAGSSSSSVNTTPEANAQVSSVSDSSAIKSVSPEIDGGTPAISESLTGIRSDVIPNVSSSSMTPAPFQSGGNCMLKKGGKSHKKHGKKSHKKHGKKSHKKHGKKSHKKHGKKSQYRNRK